MWSYEGDLEKADEFELSDSVDELSFLPDLIVEGSMDEQSAPVSMFALKAVQEATNSHYYGYKVNDHEFWKELCPAPDWTELEK